MFHISRVYIIHILSIIIIFIKTIQSKNTSNENTIQVLISNPNIESESYLNKYNTSIREYFISKIHENNLNIPNLLNYDIKFFYCVPEPQDGNKLSLVYKKSWNSNYIIDEDYSREFNCTLRALKDSTYDIIIVDDQFLYSEESYAENCVMKENFFMKKFVDYFVNYEDYVINDIEMKHHNKDIMKDGKLDGKGQYGLPYEIDYDVLYYHKNIKKLEDLLTKDGLFNVDPSFLESITNSTETINSDSRDDSYYKENGILSVGLRDNDELFEFFSEYVHYKWGIPKDGDPNSYNAFYQQGSDELYQSFREVILKLTGTNINKTLFTSLEEAYHSFINGEKLIYKGKASNYQLFKTMENSSIAIQPLPNYTSIIHEKFAVINNNSKKDKEILVKMALQLTSKDMQLYRAQELGTLPTFNFKNKKENHDTSNYCQKNSELCDLIEKIKPIHLPKMYLKNRYSASFVETRLVVPPAIRKFLKENNDTLIKDIFSNILDLRIFTFSNVAQFDINVLISTFSSFIVAFFLLIIVFKVYKYRKHPYLKAMSPQLSNLTIIGMILRIIFPQFYILIKTKTMCRMCFVINFFINNLIYIPMLAIIYRIYYIYTNISKVNYGKKVNDKHLLIIISIILFVIFSFFYLISFFDEFGIKTMGSAIGYRFVWCNFNYDKYQALSNIYNLLIVSIHSCIYFPIHSFIHSFFFFFFFLFIKKKKIKFFIFLKKKKKKKK